MAQVNPLKSALFEEKSTISDRFLIRRAITHQELFCRAQCTLGESETRTCQDYDTLTAFPNGEAVAL